MCVGVCVCVSMRAYMCLFVCLYVCMCVCVFVHASVLACVCVCVYMQSTYTAWMMQVSCQVSTHRFREVDAMTGQWFYAHAHRNLRDRKTNKIIPVTEVVLSSIKRSKPADEVPAPAKPGTSSIVYVALPARRSAEKEDSFETGTVCSEKKNTDIILCCCVKNAVLSINCEKCT